MTVRQAGRALCLAATLVLSATPSLAQTSPTSPSPSPSPAPAQASPSGRLRVLLHLDSCITGIDLDQVRYLVPIELKVPLATEQEDLAGVTRINVACAGPLVSISIEDPLTCKASSCSIDLTATLPIARARTLALAINELVRASWEELLTNPDCEARRASPAPPPGVRAPARNVIVQPRRMRLRIEAFAGLRAFLTSGILLTSLGVRVGGDTSVNASWLVDLVGEHGQTNTSFGPVSVDSATAALAFLLGYRTGAGTGSSVTIRGGAGIHAGVAELVGTSTAPGVTGDALLAVWGDAMLIASVSVVLASALIVETDIQAGYVVDGIVGGLNSADSTPVVDLQGPWLGAHLALGWSQ